MIENSRIKKIHFAGIGGSGMSGIAEVLHNMGFQICGSDIAENDTVRRLRAKGMRIAIGHAARQCRRRRKRWSIPAPSPRTMSKCSRP